MLLQLCFYDLAVQYFVSWQLGCKMYKLYKIIETLCSNRVVLPGRWSRGKSAARSGAEHRVQNRWRSLLVKLISWAV